MSCSPPPASKLKRHNGLSRDSNDAEPFEEDGMLWCPNANTCEHLSSDDREARQLAGAALRAYFALPLRGEPLKIPKCGIDDAWAAKLQTELFEILAGDDALDRMRRFSAERWLGDLVETEGTASQKAKWAEILAGLSLLDGVDVDDRDDALRGLPADLRMVAPQPLQEVEVYRSLDELEVDEEAAEDEDEA